MLKRFLTWASGLKEDPTYHWAADGFCESRTNNVLIHKSLGVQLYPLVPACIRRWKDIYTWVVIKCKLIYCINSKLLDTVSIQYQHNVKFHDFNVNTISTQHQSLTTVEILLTFSCWCFFMTFFNGPDHSFEFVQYLEFSYDHIPTPCYWILS